MITLLIVDDHRLIRFSIKQLLAEQRDIRIIGEADSGEKALQLAREIKPHVVLLDIQMPGMGGIETARKLLRLTPIPKVIVLTAHEGVHLSHHLLKLGIDGYLIKHSGTNELIKAIHTVCAGKKYVTAEVAQQLAVHNSGGQNKSILETLSERELQVMLMIAQGYTVKLITEKLFISAKTVNTYRYKLFEKLGVRNDVEVVHLAYHFGLLESGPLNKS